MPVDHSDEIVTDSEVLENGVDASAARRLGTFIERSRREAAASASESAPEPVHLVVESGGTPGQSRTARWATEAVGSGWNSARHTWADGEGQVGIRVNDRDYQVDIGAEQASTSVDVLLFGLHVFITASETGGLLRELQLNPERDFELE